MQLPILIWIPREYPQERPLAFVDLSSLPKNQRLKVGPHVDANGCIYAQVLDNWNNTSSLANVLNELQTILTEVKTIPIDDDTYISRLNKSPPLPEKQPPPDLKVVNDENSKSSISDLCGSSQTFELNSNPPPLPQKKEPVHQIPPKPPKPTLPDALSNLHITPEGPPISKAQSNLIDDNQIPNNNHLAKLKSELQKLAEEDANYVQSLRQRAEKLRYTANNLEVKYAQESHRLSDLWNKLRLNRQQLESESKALQTNARYFDDFEARWLDEDIDACKIAVTETPGLNQIYELVAEDKALSDTISCLYRMLNSGCIDLDVFIKKTRELARKQFLIKLHVQKIYQLLDTP